ncbi:MAG TPA: hypothetical protein VI279_05315 [Rhodocyclaceae bacterium]
MVTLDQLCSLSEHLDGATDSLRCACAAPRSPVDLRPLPEPHGEFAFDSSWEALFSGTGVAEQLPH